MYTIAAPPGTASNTTGTLGISGAVRHTSTVPAAIGQRPEHHPHLRTYLSDLVAPWRMPLDEPALAAQTGHSYGELGAPVIDALTSDGAPVDLLVLAFAVPDVRPGRATACYLAQLCPGDPLAFAVCDQGGAAAFTGLRLIGRYAATGGCRRALLLVAEQAGLPYQAGLDRDQLPSAHVLVGLRCETPGPPPAPATPAVTAVHQQPGVAGDAVRDALAAQVAAAADGHDDVRVLVEPHLAAGARGLAGCQVTVAPRGQLHTAGWWELAGLLDRPPAGTRVLLAGYDRQLHYLCTTTIDFPEQQ